MASDKPSSGVGDTFGNSAADNMPAADSNLPSSRARGRRSDLEGILRENSQTAFPGSNGDAFIEYNASENQVRLKWDPYSDSKLYVQLFDEKIDVEANPQAFKQGMIMTGIGRWLAGYDLTARDINSIDPTNDNLMIDDLTLKFNEPHTNYYILPIGEVTPGEKPLGIVCDTGKIRAIAVYSTSDKKPSTAIRAGLGLNIAPIISLLGGQTNITGWVSRAKVKGAAGFAVVAVPDQTQMNMIAPNGGVETIKGQVHAYTDNLKLKVLGAEVEYTLMPVMTAGLAATGVMLSNEFGSAAFIPAAISGALAGGYIGSKIASNTERDSLGDYIRTFATIGAGMVIGAGANMGVTYFNNPYAAMAMYGLDGAILGHGLGRVVTSLLTNPENRTTAQQLLSAMYMTDHKELHKLAMKNPSKDYGVCITS